MHGMRETGGEGLLEEIIARCSSSLNLKSKTKLHLSYTVNVTCEMAVKMQDLLQRSILNH